MKKFLCFLLTAALCLSFFSGCRKTPESSGESAESQTQEDPTSDTSYLEITCQEPASLRRIYLSFGEKKTILSTVIPSDWKLEAIDGGYQIKHKGASIGTIVVAGQDVDEDAVRVASQTYKEQDISLTHSILRYMTDGQKRFTRHFVFSYEESKQVTRKIAMEISYESLDNKTVENLPFRSNLRTYTTDPQFDLLSLDTQSTPKVLILGNSFISTSKIGPILKAMAGDRLDVSAISVGMARVEKYATYDEYAHYRNDIRNGVYDAVFLCGFYKDADLSGLSIFSSLCSESKTPLVVFPAHNEAENLIRSISNNYLMLNWREEINLLINQGVNYYDMCIDDTYQHSTPLAGYVGAHMIYRAIFGEVPPSCSVYYDTLTHTSVLALLGSHYVNTGTLPKSSGVNESDILYLTPTS